MPIHLPTVTRRRFLVSSLGALAGVSSIRSLSAAGTDVDPHSFALLADTHVDKDPATMARGVNMSAHCRKAVEQVLGMERKPAAMMVNGDAAYIDGQPGDYVELDRCLAPLSEADVPVHITMGNHDDRGPFYEKMRQMRPESPPLDGAHVGVVESEHVNWILVDSLHEVNVTPGLLGRPQIEWLGQILAELDDKPAILYGHHYPEWGEPGNGLRDTRAMFDVLQRHPQAKAFVFGHSHRWNISKHEGIHLVNLPAVAYVFRESETSGWVHAKTRPDGIDLTYRALDGEHEYHGQRVELNWS